MNHPEMRSSANISYPPTTSSMLQQYITSIILLVIGYYAVSYFNSWPAIFRRFTYETTVKLIPPQLIIALQYSMMKTGYLKKEDAIFQREHFGDHKEKENALRRLLGQTAIPSVLRKARTISGYGRLMPVDAENGPPGLGNWDNSCYQNSVLQGFASLPAFRQYIHRSLQLCQRCDIDGETTEALAILLEGLSDSSSQKTTLWTPTVLKSMDSWQQQDAQEYFSRVADAVEKEALQYTKILFKQFSPGLALLNPSLMPIGSDDGMPQSVRAFVQTVLNSPMDGMQAQTLECQTCGYSEGISLTQFNCLTLSLGLKDACHLEQLLDEYTEPELIEGVECDQCTKEANESLNETRSENDHSSAALSRQKKVLRTKAKQLTLGRLPRDLVFHINRSIFDDFGNQRKNSSFVQFGSTLDILNKWCPLIDSDQPAEAEDSHTTYQLQCIITHSGRHDNGHYVAYARREKDWYCFNDEIVTKISEAEVLRRGNVFMLFYEVIERTESAFVDAAEFNLEQLTGSKFDEEGQPQSVVESKAEPCAGNKVPVIECTENESHDQLHGQTTHSSSVVHAV